MERPSGTVTFLFTDIEGSTRRWEANPDATRSALALHDQVLRAAIEAHAGWLFKHTGDGVCASFSSAPAAIEAAVAAQRALELPVRMGLATGEIERRGDDYFGPVLNRAARVMAAGHGGQILVAASTASLLDRVELVDLGEHRLPDLSRPTRLFQVVAPDLTSEFGPLRSLDSVPGNLPMQSTSFVGRDIEVKEVVELVRAHRLVTLTGVGGVGKTRLAVQVTAELANEFPDGVWLVELAPVGDPAAVADVTATVLGVTAQAGIGVTDSVARALSGRRLLIVVDNCEHVLDAAADLVETLLARTSTVRLIATSREGLRVSAEYVWAVPSLDLRGGAGSAAVELFLERARAVVASFAPGDQEDAGAVEDICRRLDGIPLAIELAAARMVSMSPQDVRDRLGDRFRLLSGSRRGAERHQTLRHAVAWSYDLLDAFEKALLNTCSVFADGFDLAAATHINSRCDEFTVLDGLDSLVRKSLVTAERVRGHARYGMLETIRQFAEDQLAATHTIDEVKDRHAAYFAANALKHWELWDGPNQRMALDWVDVELANLRAGFRRATEQGDLDTAAAIAAHTAMLGFALQRLEPVGWAEEILPAATAGELAQLPRLYTAASLCALTDRAEAGVGYAQTAVELETTQSFDPFGNEWGRYWEAVSNVYAGRIERALEIFAGVATQTGPAHVCGLCGQTQMLPLLGRDEEATAIAEETLAAAQARANPYLVAWAFYAYSFAYGRIDPDRALDMFSRGLAFAREHRLPFWEANILREAARVEAVHGDVYRALTLYDSAIDSFHQAGNLTNLSIALASLAVVFGTTSHMSTNIVGKRTLLGHLRSVLGSAAFERCNSTGAAMEPADAVGYARQQIRLALIELGSSGGEGLAPRVLRSDGDV
jgi:predicted ATPase/fructose-specific component phosphotransferase system IIB-like protein